LSLPWDFLALHGTAAVPTKAIPMTNIVILAGSGNTPKSIKKAAIRAKEIPNTNLTRNPCFGFSILPPISQDLSYPKRGIYSICLPALLNMPTPTPGLKVLTIRESCQPIRFSILLNVV